MRKNGQLIFQYFNSNKERNERNRISKQVKNIRKFKNKFHSVEYSRRCLRIQRINKNPKKKKKALKNSILRDIIKVDRTYMKECPQPNKLPTFSYKQLLK